MTEHPATNFCIDVKGAAAGGIGIRLGQDVHRHTAGLGYWLGEEFWGRWITTEAVAAFTDFCFENFPLLEFTPRSSRTIWRRRVCSRKPVLFLKAVSRTTSLKTDSFSIQCFTPGLSRSLMLLRAADAVSAISRWRRTLRPLRHGSCDRSLAREELN
jgi:Acetyltransferase (GNAT) domain